MEGEDLKSTIAATCDDKRMPGAIADDRRLASEISRSSSKKKKKKKKDNTRRGLFKAERKKNCDWKEIRTPAGRAHLLTPTTNVNSKQTP